MRKVFNTMDSGGGMKAQQRMISQMQGRSARCRDGGDSADRNQLTDNAAVRGKSPPPQHRPVYTPAQKDPAAAQEVAYASFSASYLHPRVHVCSSLGRPIH